MAIYYKQLLTRIKGCFTVVEVLKWVRDDVLLMDIKSGLKYVLTSDEFLQFHEPLKYECNIEKYTGINLDRLL